MQMRIRGIVQMDKTAFLNSLQPYYNQAEQEGELDCFFDILVPIWVDRYPIEEYCNPTLRNNSLHHEQAIIKI